MRKEMLISMVCLLGISPMMAEEGAKLKQLNASIERLKQEISSLQSQEIHQNVRAQLDHLNSQIQHLQAEIVKYQENEKIHQLNASVKELKQTLSSLDTQEQSQEFHKQLENLNSEIQRFQLGSIKHQESELAALQTNFQKQIDELKNEITTSQEWEKKAFNALSKTIAETSNPNTLTPQNDAMQMQTQTKTPSSSKEACAHKRWMIDAEFLYWKLNKGNAYYAIIRENQLPYISNATSANLLGEIKRPKLKFSPGTRVGLGYRFDRDLWQLAAFYTWYGATKTDKASVSFPPSTDGPRDQVTNAPNVIVPPFEIQLHGYAGNVKSKYKFGYMIEDLRLSRLFVISRKIDLDLFFGAQSAQIRQKWSVDFSWLQNVSDNPFSAILDKNKLNWSFKGLGGNIGFDTTWYLYDRLGLFGKAAFSALYGVHKTRILGVSNENDYATSPATFKSISNATITDHRPIYGTQFNFGLSWDRQFCSCLLKLAASFETVTWQNLNGDLFSQSYASPFPTGPNVSHAPIINDTPINLTGLTLTAQLNF